MKDRNGGDGMIKRKREKRIIEVKEKGWGRKSRGRFCHAG